MWDAFLASLGEFCREEQIVLGTLCGQVRRKDGTLVNKPLPMELTLPDTLEGIGFSYQIKF